MDDGTGADIEDDAASAYAWRVRERARDTRRFALLLVLIGGVMAGVFGYFGYLRHARIDVDLVLRADEAAQIGGSVLVDAAVHDSRSGKIVYPHGVYLEVWHDGKRAARMPVQGTLRRMVKVRSETTRLRLTKDQQPLGELSAEVVVRTGDERAGAPSHATRGGMVASTGVPGLARVRGRGDCWWTMDAVAYGGVPMANVPNQVLLRVRNAAGKPVAETVVSIDGALPNDKQQTVRTDEDGYAEFRLRISQIAYVTAQATCTAGTHYTGFEVTPAFDGLSVAALTQGASGVQAHVADISDRGTSRYDLRCNHTIRAMGHIGRRGVISVDASVFSGVEAGASCILEVYRTVFGDDAPYAVRPFRWPTSSRAWSWDANADGVGLEGLSMHARSLQVGGAQLARWRAAGYHRIRVALAMMLALSMILWFVIVVRGVRIRRRHADAVFDARDEVSGGWFPGYASTLWAGWAAIAVMIGGLYIVLSLMGL